MKKSLTGEKKMYVAAHRGDSFNCFENTMEAFEAAIASGAEMIETDLRMTKDGVLVLVHDQKPSRVAEGVTRPVNDMTYEEVAALNVGTHAHPLSIPRLEELLQLLRKHPAMMLNLEFKEYYEEGNEERCEECIEKAVALLRQYGMAERMVCNSFDAHVLEYLDEHYHGEFLLHGFYPYTVLKNVTRNPDEYLYCACVSGDKWKERYDYLLEHGIEPWVGALLTEQAHLRQAWDWGARLVTANFPGDAIRKLEAEGLR